MIQNRRDIFSSPLSEVVVTRGYEKTHFISILLCGHQVQYLKIAKGEILYPVEM